MGSESFSLLYDRDPISTPHSPPSQGELPPSSAMHEV